LQQPVTPTKQRFSSFRRARGDDLFNAGSGENHVEAALQPRMMDSDAAPLSSRQFIPDVSNMIVGTTVCFLYLNARVGAWDCANHVNATDAQPQQIRVPDFVLVLIGNPKYPGNPNPAEWPIFCFQVSVGVGLRWFVARRSIQLSYGAQAVGKT